MKNNNKKSQKRFNNMMNHLVLAPVGAFFLVALFTGALNILAVVIGLPFATDSMYVLPLDNIVDNITNGFAIIVTVIALPFFIKGLFLLRSYISK